MSDTNKLFIYGIYDNKAEFFHHVYLGLSDPNVEATNFIRSLKFMRKNGLSDENISMLALYPEDFTLICLGYIDQSTGSIFNDERKIAFGYDCLEIDAREGE